MLLHQARYQPFGPVAGWRYGNGRQMTRTLDQDYRPTVILDASASQRAEPALRMTSFAVRGPPDIYLEQERRPAESTSAVPPEVYGNGLSRSLSYDQDSRLTELDTRDGGAHLQRLGYQYTQNDQIQNITNHVEPNLTVGFAYDALNRLVQHGKAATATYTSYSYDLNGNRTATGGGSADGQGPITPYQTAPGSNRLMAVGTSSFAYDANGNTIADGSRHYDYDAFNRLHRVSNAGGTHEYAINALGQRVWKQTGNGAGPSYAFTYGPSGQVEAEYAWATNSWTHYLRLPGGEPVALVRGNQRYMIHTEHLGRPEIVTNSAKAVVWRANNRSFDRGVKLDSIGGLNLGFPGQYWDQESGLWYNHFRSYDPLTGRYIESDPIGLAGGLNTYAYVGGNPVNAIDPLGLEWVTIGYDYHAVSNYGTWWLNRLNDRISQGMEPNMPGSNPNEFLNTKRDVIQEWKSYCPDGQENSDTRRREIKEGTQRRITQTFIYGPDGWAVGGYSHHWTPGVPNQTNMTIVELMQNSRVGP